MMATTFISIPATVSVSLMVIAGRFGNGDDRKQKLASAGYDPAKIQQCVNELLPIINKYGG